MQTLTILLYIMLGGAVGAACRYLCQSMATRWTTMPGWVALMVINTLGCLIIGFAVSWLTTDLSTLAMQHLNPLQHQFETNDLNDRLALIAVGFCGAFTTFSSFALDNFFLGCRRQFWMIFNMIVSCASGLIAVAAGWELGLMVAT